MTRVAEPEPIVEERELACSATRAFALFTTDLGRWWPPAYSFSQERLLKIEIEPARHGYALEVDTTGKRLVWGLVTACEKNRLLALRWMITDDREVEPDPAHASLLVLEWTPKKRGCTVRLTHDEFERHGPDAQSYRDGLASEQGWPMLLDDYRDACRRQN